MRILMLDGNQNQAVASVHSLADSGHEVLVGEASPWSKAGWSRLCRGTFQYPNPEKDTAEFIARVSEIAKQQLAPWSCRWQKGRPCPVPPNRTFFPSEAAALYYPAQLTFRRPS